MEKVITTKDGTERTTKRKPSVKEIIEAIDILLKLRGMYRPPDKRDAVILPPQIVVANQREKELIESIREAANPKEEDFF
ncbi:MAG TPA: hypothetical protein VNZ45_04895 [Bacteroidia bacterium]|jgi:hypothetical protein|nr:hypothetical protein [Bacteroidia bacterium]